MPVTSNAARVADQLDAAARSLSDVAAPATDAAQAVLDRARPPRRSGRLAASARIVGTTTGARLIYAAPYARPVHARNPWLARALAAADTAAAAALVDGITQALDRATT